MAGVYICYVGDVTKRESNGYIRARRLMKLLIKQKVHNIRYIEYPVAQRCHRHSPAVRITFD
jgi:hypothetical protein